jgi:hypothetical protein
MGIQGFAIHRNPTYMAIYLLTIVSVSILMASIYEKNTFCRYVCPVGHLLSVYSRFSLFGWRVKNKSVCDTCEDKSCINKKYQYNLNYKSCGVDLYPAKIEDNAHCILCAGSLKTCSKYQSGPNAERPNPQLTYIRFANDLFKLKPLKMAEMVFVLIVSGFVISEIWSEWAVTDKILSFLPGLLSEILSASNSTVTGYIYGIVQFALVPVVIWFAPFIVAKLFGAAIKMKNYFLYYSLAFVPITASVHLRKAVLKTTSRLPYFQHLFDDVTGISTAQKILNGEIVLQNSSVWVNTLVSVLLTLVISAGVRLSIKIVQKLNSNEDKTNSKKSFYLIPIVYVGIFPVMILSWRWF